jgi:fatty-acyl-CoA synthase
MSFGNLLDWTASRLPDKVALIGGDKRVSYAALNLLTRRAAAGLAAAGMRAGDRVARHMLNRIEVAVLYFACARLGAVAVPVKMSFNSRLFNHL